MISTNTVDTKPKVYRLRGCPAHLDRLGVLQLLCQVLGDLAIDDVRIESLATNLDPRTRPPTKVGTLRFLKTPVMIDSQEGANEWKLPNNIELENPLVLDTHFLGMTVLNDVEREKHEFDCVAISGLASHPFGSWQPKGEDKSFMWIRDKLPRAMPNIRSIEDLGLGLVEQLKASGWDLPSAKPLIFLAHSLGGIILKEAFVALASGPERSAHILNLFKGGIFFGVPSQGMATSHLLAMVKGQANEPLVADLSTESEYLRSLDDQFSGLTLTRSMCIHCAYETKTSKTVVRYADGSFGRDGPEEILVCKESATRSLYSSHTSTMFPINENHSDIVKFREGDTNFWVVIEKLKGLCRDVGIESNDGPRTIPQSIRIPGPQNGNYSIKKHGVPRSTNWHLMKRETKSRLLEWLAYPDLSSRLNTIDRRFAHTFEWIFAMDRIPLSSWLKSGKGFFWIYGKPGSGKSTLMKFICQSQHTKELVYKFPSDAAQISVSFFFHDRGTLLQKSFEGLLRSVLYQVIEKATEWGASLTELLMPLLEIRSQWDVDEAKRWTVGDLESGIRLIFQQTHLDLDIFLLLDALDEYDGQPEFICDVLEGLMKMTENSRTKLKILFSSRPWETFKQRFRHTPSVQLQDHTQNDIIDYCWGRSEEETEMVSTALHTVIPGVIARADGVFLWVKLVLYDLADEARKGSGPEELARTLDSIPSDLQKYYARTVRRIPEHLRWDACIILELLSYSYDPGPITNPLRIMGVLECARQSTYKGCRENLHKLDERLKSQHAEFRLSMPNLDSALFVDDRSSEEAKRYICEPHEGDIIAKTFAGTGNLVELKVHPDFGGITVQLAHQTVREFVHSRDFKRHTLGRRARWRHESSDVLLAKYHVANHEWVRAISYLAHYEIATGCSLKSFLDSIPKYAFYETPLWGNERIDGPLTLAMLGNLQLYLEESLHQDPDILRKTEERLLVIHPFSVDPPYRYKRFGYGSEDGIQNKHLTLIEFLFDKGYTIEQHSQAFDLIMQELKYHNLVRSTGASNTEHFFMVPLLEEKAALLVEHGQDPNRKLLLPAVVHTFPPKNIRMPQKAIHVARTARFARCLLEHGADVNEIDGLGNTALDYLPANVQLVERNNFFNGTPWRSTWVLLQGDTAKLLIDHGGMTARIPQTEWDNCLFLFRDYGLDIAPLQRGCNQIRFGLFRRLKVLLARRIFTVLDESINAGLRSKIDGHR